MIFLYVGSVGSGKSYHCVADGIAKISAWPDRFVVANFPIKFSKNGRKKEKEQRRWIYLDEFKPKDLIRISFEKKFYGKEGHALLIIDEAGLWFNSRDWNVKVDERKEWIKFFSQSRKFGYDVILVAQEERMIDRQIRSMAEYIVRHKCFNKFGWFCWLPVKMFAYVYFWSFTKFRGGLKIGILLPWVAGRYDTMKMFKMDNETLELARKYGFIEKEKEEVTGQGGAGGAGVPSASLAGD
ncbi:MAG: hypothetical protein C4589_10075 [Peptococcaceae bacterium]|nr:MAG: hypothetical protein C4589_10075 [Peptococcaceae bacterium]